MAKINITSNIGDLTGQFTNFQNLLQGGVKRAITTVSTSLKALAANPIGAVLAAVGLAVTAITAALSKFQPAIDKAEQAFAAISATVDVFVDRLQNVGVIFANFISGEASLSQTLSDLANSFDGVTEEIVKEAAAATQLEKDLQALERREIALLTVQAELRAEAREALLLSSDQNASIEERIRQLGIAENAIRQQFANEREVAEERARILREQQALGNNTIEDTRELQQLEADLIDLRAQESSQLKEISGVRSGLERQRDTQIRQQEILIEQQRQSNILNDDFLQQLRDRIAMDKRKAEAVAFYAQVEADAVRDAEYAKQDSQRATAQAATEFLTGLLGDSKAAQIAGLIATNAFEASKIITNGARASAEAAASAAALSIPTFGASLAALPAVQTAIGASTAAGLTAVKVNTGIGIASILASPGAKPSGGSSTGGGGGGGSASFGPTVSTPEITDALIIDGNDGGSEVSRQRIVTSGTQTGVAVIEQGSVANSVERQGRLNARRRQG